MTERLLWTAEELCSHIFPSTFIIEPVVPRGGLVLLYGKRGIGKSHFALTLATCLSEGGVLFGRYRTRKGPVVYVQADMGAALMQQRVRLARRSYGMDNVHFYFGDYVDLPHMDENDDLVKEINAERPELIIWDTLRQIHRMDAIASETPAWVYGNAKRLFPGVTHLFIHHEKKTVIDQDQLSEDEVFTGSGAWIDNVDTAIRLKEIGTGKLLMSFTKVRTCADQPSIALSLSLETMLLYATDGQLEVLASRWREHHSGGAKELDKFLMDSFVAPPRIIRAFAGRGGSGLEAVGKG